MAEVRIKNLDDSTHRAAKILAIQNGITLEEFCADAIRARVKKDNSKKNNVARKSE